MKTKLTTLDNPFNPFTDWENWYAFDKKMGYNTCQVLAAEAGVSIEQSFQDSEEDLDIAMRNMVQSDVFGFWIIVNEETAKKLISNPIKMDPVDLDVK